MKLYINIFWFSFKEFLNYKLDLISQFLLLLIESVANPLILIAIQRYSGNSVDVAGTFAYFFIISGIGILTFGYNQELGRSVRKAVEAGKMNFLLLKPLNLIYYLIAYSYGNVADKFFFAILQIIIGLLLFPLTNPAIQIPIFLLFFVFAYIISISFNLLEGALGLTILETSGYKNTFMHIKDFLAGRLIPLNYFSAGFQSILGFLPFSYLLHLPYNALRIENISEMQLYFFWGTFWSIVLLILSLFLWKKALVKFEGLE